MSVITIKPNGGTPFEQILKASSTRSAPEPKPQPVIKVAVQVAKPHAVPRPVPPRTVQQRMNALLYANEIRGRRAQLKRDLKAGSERVDGLVLDPPAYLETAKVVDVMLAVPKLGRVKVHKILTACRISPSKTFGGLSERQRTELVEATERRLAQLMERRS